MAISINKPGKDMINPPQIRIEGKKITNGVRGAVATDVFRTQQVIKRGLSFTRRDEVVYDGNVIVSFIPDAEFPAENYEGLNTFTPYNEVGSDTRTVVGKRPAEGKNVKRLPNSPYSLGIELNKKSNTYYTLNGKDPTRTKSYLYTGSFTIRRNTAGDNVILKVRTYVRGHWSKVRTVELKIAGKGKDISR